MRTLPPEPNPGDKITATLIRELIRAIRERTPLSGHGTKVSIGPNGARIDAVETSLKTVSSEGLKPFASRYVEEDADAGIPYTGWEIYLPNGCVSVNQTCTPMNPVSYRIETDGEGNTTERTLGGWYRMPEQSLSGVSLPANLHVVVRAKCNSAIYGVEEIDTWPKHHVLAEVCDYYTSESPGDTLSEIVGNVTVSTKDGETVREYEQTVSTPIVATAETNARFELVHAFEVDEDDLTVELRKIVVRNPYFAAAGRTIVMEDMTEIDKDAEAVYLKIDTQTGVASLMTFSGTDEDSVSDQVDEEVTDFILMVSLYDLSGGSVVHDNRGNLNNIQVYK